jgi:hypothetical protein
MRRFRWIIQREMSGRLSREWTSRRCTGRSARWRGSARVSGRTPLEQLEKVEEQKKKKPIAKKENETEEHYAKRSEPRASSTDSEARVMKMADGGYRPAYNVQFSTTTDSQIIVGVDVSNIGSDQGQLSPMLDQVQRRYDERPVQCLVDGGYTRHDDIEAAHRLGTLVYAPVPKPKDPSRDPYGALPKDSEALA